MNTRNVIGEQRSHVRMMEVIEKMSTYTTIQGDTYDSIAFKIYGNEHYMKDLIESNWQYADTLIFPSGIVLNVPEVKKETAAKNAPFWRSEEPEEETPYEYEDEPIDDEDSEDLLDAESEDDGDDEGTDEGEDEGGNDDDDDWDDFDDEDDTEE